MKVFEKIVGVLLAGLAMVGISGPASAAVPLGVEAVFTEAATDFGTIVGYGWTLFLVITGGLMLFRIASKVFSRSTR